MSHEPAGRTADGGGRAILLTLLRLAFGATLLAVLLWRIPLEELGEVFSRAADHPLPLLIAALLPVPALFAASLRWHTLLRVQGGEVPLRQMVSGMLVATFVNTLLPSTVGGDFARALWVTRDGVRTLTSLVVVTLDRLFGALSLVLLACAGVLLSPPIRELLPVAWLLPLLAVAGVAAAGAVGVRYGGALGDWLFSRGVLRRYRDRAKEIHAMLAAYRRHLPHLAAALGLSLVWQTLLILQYVLLAEALGLGVSRWELAIAVPVITLISMVPVTVNGVGLREGALTVLGASFGLTPAGAVALGWTWLGITLVYGLLGGLVQLRGRSL